MGHPDGHGVDSGVRCIKSTWMMVWAKLLVAQVGKPNLRLKRELCHVTGSLASGLTLFDPSPYLSKSKLE